MGAIDLMQALMSEGVEFATDGERIRWRNSEGRMPPEIVVQIAAAKPVVINFLTRKPHPSRAPIADKPDPETYLAFLRANGLTNHGAAAVALQWGAAQALQAEERLRAKGLMRNVTYGTTDLVKMEIAPCK